MKEAPLYNDSLQVARWIHEHLDAGRPVGRRAHEAALDLLEQVTLALHGLDREEAIDGADRAATCLRAHLRLAYDIGLLSDGGLLHVAAMLDGIGRQLGGWQRRLRGVSG